MKEKLLSNLLNQKSIQSLFEFFDNESKEIFLVGGCVRDAFFGKISRDMDVAANIHPSEVLKILRKKNLEYDDYAIKYGVISTSIEGQKFQITSLRKDFNSIGRHTNIRFIDSWKQDAARRDFTINAMYISRDGRMKDFYNGSEDLINCSIRFVKNIEDSIQEDFLRIFRYFRFLSIFEKPKLIEGYEKILLSYCEKSFNHLPNDLIRQEILKIFNSPFPLNSFFDDKENLEKRYWVELTKKHFFKTDYNIGLTRCLNKIDLLIN